MWPPKTINDLPQFRVLNVAHGEPNEDGYADFKLDGVFNQIDGVQEGRCWLRLLDRNCLFGDLISSDPGLRAATFITSQSVEPKAKDQAFPYLDGYWQAYHVWMVTEPLWKWKEVTFQPSDAIAERVPADGSTEGWIKIRKNVRPGGKERVYPIVSQGDSALPKTNPEGIVPGGWDHEHCELCNGHIDAGHVAYVDPGDHWVCKVCYTKYVLTHDLSFLQSTKAAIP